MAGLTGGPVLLPAIKYAIMSIADIDRLVDKLLMMGHQYRLIYTLLAPFNWVLVILNSFLASIMNSGAYGGLGPPGSPKGCQKERKKERERKREGRKEEKEEKKGIRKKKKGEQKKRENKERKVNQYDERGAMQFQVQAGAPGKKTSWRQIDGKKDERGAIKFQVQAGVPGKKTSGTPK